MRILHLSKFYPPFKGGLEHVVAVLAEGAARAGHEVMVVCAADAAPAEAAPTDAATGMDVIPVEGTGSLKVNRCRNLGNVWSQPITPGLFGAAGWDADLVHIHHPNPLADLVALARCTAPIVVTHHSDVRRQRLARPLYMPVINAVLRRSARILVPTTAHLEVSDELRPFREKTAIVPFGVDHRLFAPREGPARDPVEGLFVGRLVGYKGLDVLLRAVAGTSLKFAIAGDGPLKEDLRSLASELGLEGQVRFLGEVSAEELPGLYRNAGYFVLPSVTSAEMFGIVLTEAMASGLPVVYTDLETGVKEVPLEGVTGLRVPCGDSVALAGAMHRLTNEDELRIKMGYAARSRVEELFTLDSMVASHLQLYHEVCG